MRNDEDDFQTSDVITRALYVGDHFQAGPNANVGKEGKGKILDDYNAW